MSLFVAYGIEFAIQTVLIFAGLWIMIAVQKLNNHILGLLGTAALTSALEICLDHWLGMYLATSITIAVMQICVWKVTGSSNPFDVDVLFTVAVGGALTFAMNLFLIGALMGDLRPSANEEEIESVAQTTEGMEEESPKQPAATSNQVAVIKSHPAVGSPQKPTAPAEASPGELSDATLKSIKLKGLNSGARPSAILGDGTRTFTLSVGESRFLPSAEGPLTVKLESVTANTAVISINGQTIGLSML